MTRDVTAVAPREFVKEDVRYLQTILWVCLDDEWLMNSGLGRGRVQEFSEEPLSRSIHGSATLIPEQFYLVKSEGACTKANDRSLREVLYSGDQYVVPAFQRYYSWQKDNWDKLWNDIEELYSDEPTKSHFMGSLVCMPADHAPGVVPAYQLIDGQQRLVTLSLLLSALRDRSTESEKDELAEEIHEHFLVHKHKTGQERFKVFTRLRDRDAYTGIVEKQPRPAAATNSGVFAAYDYFRDRLVEGRDDGTAYDLRQLFVTVTDRLDFVLISLEGDSPFKIFKSLNSTGVPLQESDLIRNYVFMQLALNRMDRFDDDHWRPLEKVFEEDGTVDSLRLSDFFRDFLISRGEYVRKDESADAFEAAFPAGSFEPEKLADSLTQQAKYHSIIVGRSSHAVSEVQKSLHDLGELKVGTSNPLVLKLLDANASIRIDDNELLAALGYVRGIVLRRYVCGKTSRAYGRWFASACKEFASGGLDGLVKFLKEKGWPNDAEFSEALLHFNLYGSDYGDAVLRSLETAIPNKEPADLTKAQIEHVMPKTLTEDWILMVGSDHERVHSAWKDTLGNLTLTGYNPELSNKAFGRKKEIYASSGIQLNRYFADKETWTEAEIVARGKELAGNAARIFVGPPS